MMRRTRESELRTLAVFHLSEASGPSLTLEPRLRRLAADGSLTTLFPASGEGSASVPYSALGEVGAGPYQALTRSKSTEWVGLVSRLASEVRFFRSEICRVRPHLAVVATVTVPSAVVAARLEKVPVVVDADEIVRTGGPRSLAGIALIRTAQRCASAIVCASRAVARQYEDAPGPPLHTVYPGIRPPTGGDRDVLRKRFAIAPDQFCLLQVGNLTRGRGQDVLIRSLPTIRQQIPHASCVLVGIPHPRAADRAYAEELRKLAQRLGVADAVFFAGYLDHVADAYAAADIFVNPVRIPEAFGRAGAEAAAAGVPVIASNVGGIPEVFRDGRDALLVPGDEPAAIANAVQLIAGDADLRERLVSSASSRVRMVFSEDRGVAGFLGVIERVLSERECTPTGSERLISGVPTQ